MLAGSLRSRPFGATPRSSGRGGLAGLVAGVWLAAVAVGLPAAADEPPGPLSRGLAPLLAHCRVHGPATTSLFDQEVAEGERAFAAGRHAQAALAFARALRESPAHPAAWGMLGAALLGARQLDWAAQSLERALLLPGRWAEQPLDLKAAYGAEYAAIRAACEKWGGSERDSARFLLVLLARWGGEAKAAEAEARSLAKDLPEGSGRRRALRRLFEPASETDKAPGRQGHVDPFVRGVYLFYNARYAEAADAFSEAYVHEPSFARASYFLAHALFAEGRHALAAQVLVRSLVAAPGWVGQAIVLREYYKEPERLDVQVAELKKKLQASPWPEGFFLLAYVYYADGEYPSARALFSNLGQSLERRAASLQESARVMVTWTDRQIRGEIPRAARPAIEKPAERAAPSPAGAAATKGGPEAAGQSASQSQPAGPPAKAPDPEELLEQCAVALKKGEYARARTAIEGHLAAGKGSAAAWLLRAMAHLALAEHVHGGLAVRQALSAAPDPSKLRFDWTRYPSRAAFEAYVAALDKYVDAEPEMPNARFLAGFVHYSLGHWERSLKLFKRNLWLDPNDRQSRLYIDLITRQIEKPEGHKE